MSVFSEKQRGAVSLFLVIFSAMLIVTVTVAFISIMILDQQQATANDLSKSALDSANAGVEDAKRAILTFHNECNSSASTSQECGNLATALNSSQCDTIQKAGIAGSRSDQQVLVGQNEGATAAADQVLQQYYTCVKVALNTADYVGTLKPGQSRVIPLKSTQPFDQVTIEWYSQNDLQNAQVAAQSDGSKKISLGTDMTLPKAADWPQNRPSLLRTQLLQFGSSFKVTDFDAQDVNNANTATLFLMPSAVGAPNNLVHFTDDYAGGPLEPVQCDQNFSTVSTDSAYACKVTVTLPLPVGSTDNKTRTAYLRLQAPYNVSTNFRITMQDSTNAGSTLLFGGVQPSIDSTGRANDLFRRVVSRVELNDANFPYIESTLDVTGDLCKTFSVSDTAQGYDPGACNPN